MTPQQQIDELKKRLDDMERSSTLPREMGDAIAERLSDKEQTISRASTKAAGIYKRFTLSGGVEVIDVCAFPDGFRVFRVGGKDYYIPYYNLV